MPIHLKPASLRHSNFRDILNRGFRIVLGTELLFPPLPTDNRILFFERDRADFGFLSNFYPSHLVLDGRDWTTVEHFYQASKSQDEDYIAAIASAGSPGRAKRLGDSRICDPRIARQSWFRKHPEALRKDWDVIKLDVMHRAITAKFQQNTILTERLLATGHAELVEDSTSDAYWGSGSDGQGYNQLGRILMAVRAQL